MSKNVNNGVTMNPPILKNFRVYQEPIYKGFWVGLWTGRGCIRGAYKRNKKNENDETRLCEWNDWKGTELHGESKKKKKKEKKLQAS